MDAGLRGVSAPFPKVFGDGLLGNGLLNLNLAAIKLSKTLFSYQIFVVAESTPGVEFVLRDSKARSNEVAAKNRDPDAKLDSGKKRARSRGKAL